jgi:FkbM family methyltransferase
MKKQLKHHLYRLFNRTGFRFILAAAAATYATVRLGKLCKVFYDGEWIHRFPSCTIVEPRLTLWTPKEIERHTYDLFLHQYRPKEGDTIIDVGAGTGWETLTFSTGVGMSGRVISIEAHPRVFRCLSKMHAENRLNNVTLLQTAVADQEGEVQLTDSLDHEANSIIGVPSGIRVPCTTLEHIFRSQGLSRVDFLKMNIEGAERLALSGMGEMVRKTKNVLIACHDFLADMGGPNEFRTKAEVIAFLEQNGFVVSIRESEGDFLQNFVYGRNEKLLKDS